MADVRPAVSEAAAGVMTDENAHVRKHLTRAHDIMAAHVIARQAMAATIDAALKLQAQDAGTPAPEPQPREAA